MLDEMLPNDDLQLVALMLQGENDQKLKDMLERVILPRIKGDEGLFIVAMRGRNPHLRWKAASRMKDVGLLTQFTLQIPAVGPWKMKAHLSATA